MIIIQVALAIIAGFFIFVIGLTQASFRFIVTEFYSNYIEIPYRPENVETDTIMVVLYLQLKKEVTPFNLVYWKMVAAFAAMVLYIPFSTIHERTQLLSKWCKDSSGRKIYPFALRCVLNI